MKHILVLGAVLAMATLTVAQPASPPISQLTVFFCNPSFSSCPLGFDPTLPPLQLSDGNLYVATFWGGQGNPNFGGTVFRSSLLGQGLVLHTFGELAGRYLGGENPVVSLAQGADGNIYGVT